MEDNRRKKREWPLLVVLLAALALLPVGLYTCGYFWLGAVDEGYWVPENIPVVHRTYHYRWQAQIFEPAGRLEEYVLEHEVEVGAEAGQPASW